MQPYELLDPKCPDAEDLLKSIKSEVAVEGLDGLAAHRATMDRFSPLAVDHKKSCSRCRSFRPGTDNRSAVGGGFTIGLLAGLALGFFRDNYWETVVVAVLVGTALGVAANLLASLGSRLARR